MTVSGLTSYPEVSEEHLQDEPNANHCIANDHDIDKRVSFDFAKVVQLDYINVTLIFNEEGILVKVKTFS